MYKPYPTNHFTHPAIDCALALRAGGLSAADVVAELGVAAAPLRTIGEPRTDKIRPQSRLSRQVLADRSRSPRRMLGGGGLGVYLDDFADTALTDPARLALAAKVAVVADPIATTSSRTRSAPCYA